jgi:hypothetical protein
MASLRTIAGCLGLLPKFRVLRHFFGYASAPPWTRAPSIEQPRLPQKLSLLTQVKRVQQPYFNLNLVRVGVDPVDHMLAPEDEECIDCAVQLTREIYSQIGVGVGKVDRWFYVPYGTQYDVIDDDCEATELIDAYDLPGDGIKVFFVLLWLGGSTVGITDGDRDGSAVWLRTLWYDDTFVATARSLAHELGHMFGLGHQNDDPANLMCQGGHAKAALNIGDDKMIPATTHFDDSPEVMTLVSANPLIYLTQAEQVKSDTDWIRGPCP